MRTKKMWHGAPPTDDTAALRCIDQVDINQARLRL
jgi:hypothetical protein